MEDKEFIDKILDDVEFETSFYDHIAGQQQYDVIQIDFNPSMITDPKEEFQRKALEAQCERSDTKVLYRISYGNYAVVVAKGSHEIVGLVPEFNNDGWPC